MMVLVTLRRQKVCIALRALTGYFSYINTELFLALFLKIYIFFPLLWKWWLHKSCYLLWAMLWGFILWHPFLTLLSWGIFCRDPLTACQKSWVCRRRCQGILTKNRKLGHSFDFAILFISSTSKILHRRLLAIWLFRVLIAGKKGSQYCFHCNQQKHTVQLMSGVVEQIPEVLQHFLQPLVWSLLCSGIDCQCFIRSTQKWNDCRDVCLVAKPRRSCSKAGMVLGREGVCGQ